MQAIRVDTHFVVPRAIVVVEPSEHPGGMPRKLGTASRVPAQQSMLVSGIPATFGPAKGEGLLPPGHAPGAHDVALLALQVQASDFESAATLAQPTIELLLDSFSFQLQTSLHIVAQSLIDVTGPLVLGQVRKIRIIANPSARTSPKFYGNPLDFSHQIVPAPIAMMTDAPILVEKRHRLALWWYIKALAIPFSIDKLLFLFTAIEQLAYPHLRGPYKTDCNHEIANCPTCQNAIRRPQLGPSIRNYLVEISGLTTMDAEALWKVRQAVHGKDIFTIEEMDRIAPLLSKLRMAVFNGLKVALGIPESVLPASGAIEGAALSAEISLSGERRLNDDDLLLGSALAQVLPAAEH